MRATIHESGDAGDDTLVGGAGTDAVSYLNAKAGITLDLSAGTATGEGADSLSGIEAVAGSAFDDSLTGGADNQLLTGNAGNDTLDGGEGDDTRER